MEAKANAAALTRPAGVQKSAAKKREATAAAKGKGASKAKIQAAKKAPAARTATTKRAPTQKLPASKAVPDTNTIPNTKKTSVPKKALASKTSATSNAPTTSKARTTTSKGKGKATAKPTAKTPAKTSNKRKNDEENGEDGEERAPPPAKKARVTETPVTKKRVAINEVPTQRLNVYVFGEGSSSELGLGTAKTAIDVKRPRLNPLLSAKDVGVVQIATGGMHVAALTDDNRILTWGVNDQGALGRDTTWDGGLKDMDDNKSDDSGNSDSGLNPHESYPTAIPASSFPEGTIFVKLSAGDSHTLALTDDGLVYGWGTFRVILPATKISSL